MSRPLAVDAELTLSHDGKEIAVWDDADALVVDAPSYGAARALLRTIAGAPAPPAALFGVAPTSSESGVETDAAIAAASGPEPATDGTSSLEPATDGKSAPIGAAGDFDLDAALDRHDLTVEIRVRDATVARLGGDATPTGLNRWLAARLLPVPAAISLRGVLVAAARRVG
ncbi:hypothetical protein [Haloparvum sp. AD34]